MPAPVLLDATPLASGHGARGIGAAVRGMLAGLAGMAPEDRPRLLVRDGPAGAGGVRRGRRPLAGVAAAPPARPLAGAPRASAPPAGRPTGRPSTPRRPSLVPPGRTVVTCFDLIPAAFAPEYLGGAGRAGQRAAFARFLRAAAGGAAGAGAVGGDRGRRRARWRGVDPGRVRMVPARRAAAPRAPEGDVPDGPYVLYAGAIEPHKNAGLALEAIAAAEPGRAARDGGPWSARRAARLRGHAARVGADGRVDWLGYVPAGRLAALRARGGGGARALAQGGLRLPGARGDGRRRPRAGQRHAGAAGGGGRRRAPPTCRRRTPARGRGRSPGWRSRRRTSGRAWPTRAGGGRRSSRGRGPRRGIVAAHREVARVTRVAIDCHMVGQSAAGDAGNGRYARSLRGGDGRDRGARTTWWRRSSRPRRATRALERFGPTPGGAGGPTSRGWRGPRRGPSPTSPPRRRCSPTSRRAGPRARSCSPCTTRRS